MMSAGMAADKHAMSTAQAEALGMLSPTAGVAAMERMLRGATAGLAAGVRGVAAPGYWRLLLQSVKHKPAMFSAVLDSADEVHMTLVYIFSQLLLKWFAVRTSYMQSLISK